MQDLFGLSAVRSQPFLPPVATLLPLMVSGQVCLVRYRQTEAESRHAVVGDAHPPSWWAVPTLRWLQSPDKVGTFFLEIFLECSNSMRIWELTAIAPTSRVRVLGKDVFWGRDTLRWPDINGFSRWAQLKFGEFDQNLLIFANYCEK
jgi:hypothetical protein